MHSPNLLPNPLIRFVSDVLVWLIHKGRLPLSTCNITLCARSFSDLGEENAINSASHGAGRLMSRTQAIKSITKAEMKAILAENQVMGAQKELVDTIAKFYPKIVRMADGGSRED